MATSSSFSGKSSSVLFREGKLSDCEVLAELINESAEGAIDYLFSELVFSGTPTCEMGRLLRQEVYYSYANAIVAEADGKVIGSALCFPAEGLMISEQMEAHYSTQKLQYIRYFVENKIDGYWHLDALCVEAAYRNEGVGEKLLAAVKSRAKQFQYKNIGVFVFCSNTAAIRFYVRHGFIERKTIDTKGHEFLGSKHGLSLMEFSF